MDVLTDLLSEVYLSGEVVARFDLNAPWGISMPPRSGIFHAISQGDCWARLSPDGELFRVSAGDLLIFPEGASHGGPLFADVATQQGSVVGQSPGKAERGVARKGADLDGVSNAQ